MKRNSNNCNVTENSNLNIQFQREKKAITLKDLYVTISQECLAAKNLSVLQFRISAISL